jgi:hypothetical protein
LKQIHRRRVANGVTGDAATPQRWAVRLSSLDVQLKPLLNCSPSHRLSEAIRQQRLICCKIGKPQPGTDVLSGFFPQGHRSLLSAFARQLHSAVIVSLHVLHPDGESLGYPGSGIVEKKKEQMITPAAPGVVHRLQESLHFALRKKAKQRTGESFEGNGHDTQLRQVHAGVDGGRVGAGGDSIDRFALQNPIASIPLPISAEFYTFITLGINSFF